MNIVTLKQDYDYFTRKLSEIARQLNYVGVAIIWIFRVGQENGGIAFSKTLLWPLGMFATSLALDLLHYIVSTLVWGGYFRRQDKKGLKSDTEFRAPKQLNWPSLLFFWTKIALTVVGFVFLVKYIVLALTK